MDGLSLEDVKPDTVAVSSRLENQNDAPPSRPLVPPVHNASTYQLYRVKDYLEIYKAGRHLYSRLGNSNADSVECVIADFECGAGSLVFASGNAAMSTSLLTFLSSGDHIVCTNPAYTNTLSFIQHTLSKFNVEVTFAESGAPVETWRPLIKHNTKILYGETPCNPDMSIRDLEAFGKLGQEMGILTFVDSTFGSPYLQQPIKYGIDISLHSATKYLGGHSDLVAGVITTRTSDLWRQVKHKQMEMGTILSPQCCSLLLRGLKTLPLRMAKHSSNAMKLAQYLENHPKVARVRYPGLKSHPQHEVAARQMKDYSGMVMVEMKGGLEAAATFVESIRVIFLAVSLGAVESLMEHPATMTHGPMFMSDEDRRQCKITDGMVRFSVGIEDPDDLLADLEQALDKVPE